MDIYNMLYHLARVSLNGKKDDVLLLLNKYNRSIRKENPEISKKINSLLVADNNSFRAHQVTALPVNSDSRLDLIKFFEPLPLINEPIWNSSIESSLMQIIEETKQRELLIENNIPLTTSLMFYGDPGVGKTLAAKWLSWKLGIPLLVLDLSAVMSSYLGKTGSNIKHIFSYAKKFPNILLLDEFDAIAKKRDDLSEIGELKRLVTVLLQEIDDWGPNNILVAATNHPALLDPAIWRRFDMLLEFTPPKTEDEIKKAVSLFLEDSDKIDNFDLLCQAFKGYSYSDIEREILRFKRQSIVYSKSINAYVDEFIINKNLLLTSTQKKELASELVKKGYSLRKISLLLNMSRNSIPRSILET